MERPKRIGLYGGTFDPVHIGHMAIGRAVSALFEFDEFLFVPAHTAPHKRYSVVTPALHRYAMLALATHDRSTERVSTAELEAPDRPYTADTIAHFRSVVGRASALFFIMGVDSWSEIASWWKWESLIDISNLIIVTRPGIGWSTGHVTASYRNKITDIRGMRDEDVKDRIAESTSHRIYITDAVSMEISATLVRNNIRTGAEAAWVPLVPPLVGDYIKKYELYREIT